ncbi:undecaprenyl-diphosphate phosphatase [Oleisolibacter albus]|uniref:undecaprenyl-diphosphate phosphatase n=1 Tax=Oleisolibacter albus TaxID=2171757 RepID=UPI00195F8D80|nr:undecaprenyl-diphosphate phosphatase [Oleisolibacter albus]
MTDLATYLDAVILGVVEGLLEFLPVSSTGHLLLAGTLLGWEGPPGKVFEVVIQLGAILAVVVTYFHRLWTVLVNLPSDPRARRFAAVIILAFLPSAVIGAKLHGFIKGVLFDPVVVCVALIVGGFVILFVERRLPASQVHAVEEFSFPLALKIGFCQCLAMIPGVSRSGATIIGALLMGVERKTAAEFSFFLAIPTMLGATVYDVYKNRDVLSVDSASLIAVGFVVAFIAALASVRLLLGIVTRYGFAPFAWYRIAAGSLFLVGLYLWG